VSEMPTVSKRHFLIFLAIAAAVTGVGFQQSGGTGPRKDQLIAVYVSAGVLDWLLFFYCWRGVRAAGGTLRHLIGGRWPTLRDFLKDLVVAAAFWVAAGGMLWWLSRPGGLLNTPHESTIVAALLPRTPLQIGVWIAVSLTAGFCEEFVFRGYVQRQLRAWSGNVLLGLAGQALVFGAMHAYQGVKQAALIVVYGLMFGALAAWRKSLRPGMIAHAWEDVWSGWLSAILPR